METTPLQAAVDAAGGQSAFARFVGVSQPTVWAWLRQGKPLPAEFVLKTEAAYGVSRHDLRPDLYPLEDGHLLIAPPDVAEWPVASPGMTGEISGAAGTGDRLIEETAPEPEASQSPFAPGGVFPPTSIRTCPTCDAPATPKSQARSSPGLQDAEAA